MKNFLILGAVAALAACASSSEAPSNGNIPASATFASGSTDSIQSRLNGTDAVSFATNTASLARTNDNEEDRVPLGERQSIEIVVTPDGEGDFAISLTAFGRTTELTSDDLQEDQFNEFKKQLADGITTVYLWTFEENWESFVNGDADFNYLVPFGTSDVNSETNLNNRAYGVVGLVTPETSIPTSGTVTYDGGLRGEIFTNAEQRSYFGMDVELNVDFEQAKIAGKLDDLRFRVYNSETDTYEWENDPDVFNVEETDIASDGFSTTLTVDAASCGDSCATFGNTEMTGVFYGPKAEEIGGSVLIEGTTSTEAEFVGQAAFAASQN